MDKMVMLVGTIGQGVMRSADHGESWQRIGIYQGMHSDAMVRTLAHHPHRPEVVYAGTDKGLYRSDNAGESWEHPDSPLSPYAVWALTIDSQQPENMLAGTGTPNRSTLFQSGDGGQTWEERQAAIADECPNVGIPRVTGIAIDPVDRGHIWMGIEVDGVRHSSDGGQTWETINGAIPNPDVHSVTVAPGPPKTIFVVVNNEVYTSTDDGATWTALRIRETFPWSYPRSIFVPPDQPQTVFLTIGDTTPGRIGTVMRSKDVGKTWESLPLPTPPNSAMWSVHARPDAPDVMLAGSRYGYLYRSDDGGDTWHKLWRELSEINSLLAIPA
ncbi:MAG: hypothetical protein ETSY2_46655 [Candidatus Entotheonella gemina]|uniref:Sortilin N-terminal domain-containing protein n=1 Tax=Candidatus Entotheonella gemina TaxID=1429439 RepID=W4LG74_9BACT|nr:MAG: hypothetical protein ETSY2_46655 [Candidatus Entotheonella gemina]